MSHVRRVRHHDLNFAAEVAALKQLVTTTPKYFKPMLRQLERVEAASKLIADEQAVQETVADWKASLTLWQQSLDRL